MKLASLLILMFLISSCKKERETKAQAEKVNSNGAASVRISSTEFQRFKGTYVGRFLNKFGRGRGGRGRRIRGSIMLSIDEIDERKQFIKGHRISEGKRREFIGTFRADGKNALIAEEDDKSRLFRVEVHSDGRVELRIELGKINGQAYLLKKPFVYNAEHQVESNALSVFLRTNKFIGQAEVPRDFNASTTKLTKADLKGLKLEEAKLIRKTIYARHGYAFSKDEDIAFFDYQVDWYGPYFVNVDHKLSELEDDNIALLEAFEYEKTNKAPREN